MDRPRWLDDTPEIRVLLAEFLDRLDRKADGGPPQLRAIKIEPKRFPGLFRFDEDAKQAWQLLQSLRGTVIEIELDRKRKPYDAEYVGARARLIPSAEDTLRHWLDRPRVTPHRAQWREAVARHRSAFADAGAALAARPIDLAGKTMDDIVGAFARLPDQARADLTLRQLSARCFWGHSKLLDEREELLAASFPSLRWQPRPIVVNVFLPPRIDGVLFIENQDTYTSAVAGVPDAARVLALVYAAGFRGSGQRVRAREGVSLHYHAGSSDRHRTDFESWWFADDVRWPTCFWGDLDYAGLAILKALRARFGDVRAWEPGYAPMLRLMQSGGGHVSAAAGKEDQVVPSRTGCPYSDEVLLPAIHRHGLFVDQEAVSEAAPETPTPA